MAAQARPSPLPLITVFFLFLCRIIRTAPLEIDEHHFANTTGNRTFEISDRPWDPFYRDWYDPPFTQICKDAGFMGRRATTAPRSEDLWWYIVTCTRGGSSAVRTAELRRECPDNKFCIRVLKRWPDSIVKDGEKVPLPTKIRCGSLKDKQTGMLPDYNDKKFIGHLVWKPEGAVQAMTRVMISGDTTGVPFSVAVKYGSDIMHVDQFVAEELWVGDQEARGSDHSYSLGFDLSKLGPGPKVMQTVLDFQAPHAAKLLVQSVYGFF